MEYFKVNYNKLKNLQQIKFFKIIFIIIVLFVFVIILSLYFKIYSKSTCYGIYSNNLLLIKINNELSDKIKNSEYITFNNKITGFKINGFLEYEIIDNDIYQEVELIVDKEFYDNEVGVVTFYYDKKNILKYILDLFK